MQHFTSPSPHPLTAALFIALLALAGCGGNDSDPPLTPAIVVPDAPKDPGFVDIAPEPAASGVIPFVDNVASNQRGDARYATLGTNAGVSVVARFLDLWTPSSLFVDAGVSAPANGSFPAVTAANWSGIPGDATDGKASSATGRAVLDANIQYVVKATSGRTPEQANDAYFDDRRGKGYSVTDGLGPLTIAWRTGAQQTTTITTLPADAGTVLYNDGGNNTGVGSAAGNTAFGSVVDFVNSMGNNGSTEPAKRFYKYARPWRWSSSVVVVPALEPAKSKTPATDSGFISGHAAEATRDAIGMAYLVPERFQELLSRGLELGENRILAGMHSPLDVIGGRIQAQAVAAANILAASAETKAKAFADAHTFLQAQVGVANAQALNDYAHSGNSASDRFADYASNKANYRRRLNYGFAPIGSTSAPAVVPKGAEVLLETRLPYLSAAQRRVVLKTTALTSGYPLLDDAEGWGRLDLFAAADGYGVFTGNVVVVMDAAKGGFNAVDRWHNDISGTGKLTKQGSGLLKLSGNNSWSGGTQIDAGTLEAGSVSAFGTGDVYVGGGTLLSNAAGALVVSGKYTQLSSGTLALNLGGNQQGRLAVRGALTLSGGTLNVTFQKGFNPAVGDTIAVISCASRQGSFATVSAEGHKVTPIYTSTGVQLRIES